MQVLTLTPNPGESDKQFAARIVQEMSSFGDGPAAAEPATDVSAEMPDEEEQAPAPT